jgi:hypothetical protein
MKRSMLFLLLFSLLWQVAAASSEQKPLKGEELLKLRNYELTLQNMELRIELMNREMEKLRRERDLYLEELYRDYGLDREWKIDLEKGIWFIQESPEETKEGTLDY